MVLLTGPAGTGKTTAAQAIAHSLQRPLVTTDLALLDSYGQKQVWAEIQLVRYLISTITAFSKPVLKRICSNQHQSKFN
ncbi:MAG: AAA family ATPase [Hormoscilla sp. GM102CHS1]|nr:AAA family ATPase [Hormoscilla sp. GM102CHS1]